MSSNEIRSDSGGRTAYRLPFALALLLALLCFLLCLKFGGMFYLQNDDTSIQNTLSGYTAGEPFPVHPFIGVWLGQLISRLYLLEPHVQWWYVYSQTLMMLSVFAIDFSILAIAKKEKFSLPLAFLSAAFINAEFLLYPIANLSFTIVPAVCGTAVALCLIRKQGQKLKWWEWLVLFAVFVLLLSHRTKSGELALCFIILALFYYFFSRENKWLKNALCFALSAVFLIAATAGLVSANRSAQKEVNGEEFVEFNSARSAYMDYPHDTFSENPEIFEAVGWDAKLYQLVKGWCFMDERVNAESFRYLVEHSRNKAEAVSLRTMWHRWNKLQSDPMNVSNEIVWAIVALTAFWGIVLNWDTLTAITYLFNVAGAGILVLYQLYTGRIVYRSYVIVLIPSALINLILLMKCRAAAVKKGRREKLSYILAVLMILLSLPWTVNALHSTFDAKTISLMRKQAELDRTVCEYAIEHSGNVYIKKAGVSSSINPANLYPDEKPTNLLGWGGAEFNSRSNKLRLQRNGLTELTGEVFRRDNAFFISNDDLRGAAGELPVNNDLTVFYLWLQEGYGASGIVQEEDICPGVFVYRFVFEQDPDEANTVFVYQDGHFAPKDA